MGSNYILRISVDKSEDQLVAITDKLLFGSSESCDVCFSQQGIEPEHLMFRVSNGVLTVKSHALTPPMLGNSPLKKRKMVIIDDGDTITIEGVTLTISKESGESDDDEQEKEELPTATTLFKLAKADLETSEDVTGEVDISTSEDVTDEDEYETTSDSSPSKLGRLIRSFKNIFRKKRKKISLKKRQRINKSIEKRAGLQIKISTEERILFPVLSRIYALMASYVMAYTIYSIFKEDLAPYLTPALLIAKIDNVTVVESLKIMAPSWEIVPITFQFYIQKFIPLLILVTAQDILSSLLLGSPLPLFLLGVMQQGNILTNRLTAVLKSIIGILHPFIIFDLPLIFGKPSLKEILTFRFYCKGNSKIRTLSGEFIFLPLIIIAGIIAPLLLSPHFSHEGIRRLPNDPIVMIKKMEDRVFNSTTLHFSAQHVRQDITLIPTGWETKSDTFTLKLFTAKKDLQVTVAPFHFMPELVTYLQNHNPIYKLVNSKEITAQSMIETFSTIFDLSINPDSIVAFLLQHGPMVSPALQVTQRLQTLLSMKQINSYQIIVTEHMKYLKLTEGPQVHVISLTKPFLKFSYKSLGVGTTLANTFPQDFLVQLQHSKQSKVKFIKRKLEDSNSINPFLYLDLILNKKSRAYAQRYYRRYKKILQKNPSKSTRYKKALQDFTKLHTFLSKKSIKNKRVVKKNKRANNQKRKNKK